MNGQVHYSLDDLRYLMSRLRDPKTGCPWDIKQTARDIINYSIEEIYELADAVERNNAVETRDELGDVLFQVVFLSHLAEENGDYNWDDVVTGIVAKLLRRHPHVFADGNLRGEPGQQNSNLSDTEIKQNWESIKQQERDNKNLRGLFDDVPLNLPALSRAAKLQKRASVMGLDWDNAEGPLEKVREETEEVAQLMAVTGCEQAGRGEQTNQNQQASDNQLALTEELGDLLFSTVNLCRKLGVNPEQAMRVANQKFVSRAQVVCQHPDFQAASSLVNPSERLAALEALWQLAKNQADSAQ